MPIYTYRCPGCGHTAEMLRPVTVEAVICSCGQRAPRVTVNRVAVIAPAGPDSRGMFRRYQESTQEIDYAASKEEARTGQDVRTPDLWSAAKATAAAIERAGENPLPHNGRIT